MNEFVADMKTLFEAYQNHNKDQWNAIVAKANENAPDKQNSRFCEYWHPHFYSGKLLDKETLKFKESIKYLIITMNPALGKNKECTQAGQIEGKNESFVKFVDRQNNWFDEQASERGRSMIYDNANKSLKLLHGEDPDCEGRQYGYLSKYAVVVDWFPFYSKSFKLKKGNSYPGDRLKIIFSLAKELNANRVIALGAEIKTALAKFMDRRSISKEYEESRLDIYVRDGITIYSYLVGYQSDKYFEKIAELIHKA